MSHNNKTHTSSIPGNVEVNSFPLNKLIYFLETRNQTNNFFREIMYFYTLDCELLGAFSPACKTLCTLILQ